MLTHSLTHSPNGGVVRSFAYIEVRKIKYQSKKKKVTVWIFKSANTFKYSPIWSHFPKVAVWLNLPYITIRWSFEEENARSY